MILRRVAALVGPGVPFGSICKSWSGGYRSRYVHWFWGTRGYQYEIFTESWSTSSSFPCGSWSLNNTHSVSGRPRFLLVGGQVFFAS